MTYSPENITGPMGTYRYEKEEELNPNDPQCRHTLRMGPFLCAVCGSEISTGERMYAASHTSDQFLQTAEAARREQEIKNNKLDENKKLILILDLDQTLIHTALDKVPCNLKFFIADSWFYVKYRPYLKSFLRKVNKLFEIHIYTMGARDYAYNICKALDPTGELFGTRIVSRSENFNELTKNISRISCISDNIIILDDRADVWNYTPNLLLVRPFYFYNKIDINDPHTLVRGEKEKGSDGMGEDDLEDINVEGLEEKMPLNCKDDEDEKFFEEKGSNNSLGSSSEDGDSYKAGSREEERDRIVHNPTETKTENNEIIENGGLHKKKYREEEAGSSKRKKKNRHIFCDTELLRLYGMLKKVHRKYFKHKKSVQEILKLTFLEGISFICRTEYFPLVEACGGQINFSSPHFVIENSEQAHHFKVPNVSVNWIYESVYSRRLVNFVDFIIDDFREGIDQFEQELLDEFF